MIKRIFIVLTLASFFISSPLRAAEEEKNKIYQKLETLSKVLSYVEANYIEKVNVENLLDEAIKGMLSELDPHTMYMPPNIYNEMKSGTSGDYGGVGIEVGIKDDVLVVISPIENSPAQKEGIAAGDLILKIDGESTQGMTLVDSINKIRGRLGSKIKFTLKREGKKDLIDVVLKRQKIETTSISSRMIDKSYGYIKISSFQDRTERDLKKHISQLSKKTDSQDLKGLIIDLRNNPGGLFEQAVKVSDLFLEEGVIVSTRGRKGTFEEVRSAQKPETLSDLPLVLLINEGSASAAEIFAGAMQDHQRAAIVGKPSFGKGSVQTVIDLQDGSGFKMTVAKYYTPSGRSIQEKGIIPDILLSDVSEAEAKALREKDLKGHIAGDREPASTLPKKTDSDAQLTRAVEYLKAGLIFRKLPFKS